MNMVSKRNKDLLYSFSLAAQLTSTVATVSEGQDYLSKQIKTLNILLEQASLPSLSFNYSTILGQGLRGW